MYVTSQPKTRNLSIVRCRGGTSPQGKSDPTMGCESDWRYVDRSSARSCRSVFGGTRVMIG